ncbi:hypothetical protein SCD_n00453 [Sulfuricella denitrificans skB26]|uniref:Cytochrome C oxidase subunit III n=1 Tax=Sulfuricella denitrificans (strain DSM 22764 / NBRC 105220 / skB26) TaxID=1163617 RepID=S6B0U2_SULDS|nr:hypothetical protein [Sulfuricella denitrificans]BAN34302.1 hypothetical protein SCD_n00453 [Sulfuricella denitrificans skB26]
MPVSEDSEQEIPGQSLAIWTEVLYLSNLLIAPGLAFLILLWLYFKRSANMPTLALCHLRQTISASVWAGVLLVIANITIILLGGYAAPKTWVIVIIYFTTCHSTLVLLGVLGLAKAMAGQKYIYPLVGRPCD